MSNISRVQTVVSIDGQTNHENSDKSFNSISHANCGDISGNYEKLQDEIMLLQEKLNKVKTFFHWEYEFQIFFFPDGAITS